LKSDLQQFRELEAFAAFGSDLDPVSQAQLDRGYRLTELLKQGISSPMPVEEQVVSLYAGTNGFLDSVAVEDVLSFETGLLEWVKSRNPDLLRGIVDTGKVDTDELDAVIGSFGEQFVGSSSEGDERAPEAKAQAAAETAMVDADNTLPEEDITRDEES